jgi:hypothetical protein
MANTVSLYQWLHTELGNIDSSYGQTGNYPRTTKQEAECKGCFSADILGKEPNDSSFSVTKTRTRKATSANDFR